MSVTALGFEEQREKKLEIEEYEDDANVIPFGDEVHSIINVEYVPSVYLKNQFEFAFANFN